MSFTLPALPWAIDALAAKGISAEQVDFHYNKHHKGYVTKLNAAAESRPELKGAKIEDLINNKDATYNLAAQIWNHTFYWNCMSPNGGGEPTGAVKDQITKDFGSFDEMKKQFSAAAAGHFGSGWAWLVKDGDKLRVHQTHDAGCPLSEGLKPVLTCDVWEHAFYIDYRNDKAKYVETFWNAVNWDFVNSQL
eukprot:TRINITY_DN2486_c0_g1_i1.p1 TRINITY_DN2486_c0_g1~~TRINITY_DN2486_c0_g1_i1.p1  ORF type:complete len:211 (+),score=66.16 TRINITY_DN2486_c0_g1_i1:58-633(+)